MAKLTTKLITSAKATTSDIFLMDDALPGFGCRIYPPSKRHPAGRRVFFVRTYPSGSKKECRTAIGDFGEFSLDDARVRAIELIALANEGMSPTEQSKQKKAEVSPGISIADLKERYFSMHVNVHCTPSSRRGLVSLFKCHILPRFGRCNVETLSRGDVARHHAELGTTNPEVANRMVTALAAMLAWGTSHGYRRNSDTPCRFGKRGAGGIKKFQETPRERFLAGDELQRLEEALREAESIPPKRKGHVHQHTCELIRTHLYSGARFAELRRLTWSMVDLKARVLKIYKTKEKRPKFIALNDQAIEVLQRHAARTGAQDSCRVFECYNPQRAWMYIIRPSAGLGATDETKAFRLHDFRHNFVSAGVNSGVPLSTIGRAVGHSNIETTKRYAHYADATLLAAVQKVGDKIKSDE